MNILNNLFRRRAGFKFIPQTTFEAMEKRHSMRSEFTEPQTYAEFMKRYSEVGQRCNFSKAWNTEEMLWRAQNLQILQRSAMALYTAGQFAPPSMRRVEANIKKWQKQLAPVKVENKISRFVQLILNFGV